MFTWIFANDEIAAKQHYLFIQRKVTLMKEKKWANYLICAHIFIVLLLQHFNISYMHCLYDIFKQLWIYE